MTPDDPTAIIGLGPLDSPYLSPGGSSTHRPTDPSPPGQRAAWEWDPNEDDTDDDTAPTGAKVVSP